MLISTDHHYFKSPFAIYQLFSFSSKIQLVSITKCFYRIIRKNINHSEHFIEKEKNGNHLVQGVVNMVDGVNRSTKKTILFLAWFLLIVSLRYHKETAFSFYWRMQGVWVCRVECLIAVLKLKRNKTTVIPLYIQHQFSRMKLYLWGRFWRFILVNPLPFTLKTFSSALMISLRNKSF